jgi:hypothetical protein
MPGISATKITTSAMARIRRDLKKNGGVEGLIHRGREKLVAARWGLYLGPMHRGTRGRARQHFTAWYRRGAAAITKAEVAGSFDRLMTRRAATIGSALEKGQDPFAMLVDLQHRYIGCSTYLSIPQLTA